MWNKFKLLVLYIIQHSTWDNEFVEKITNKYIVPQIEYSLNDFKTIIKKYIPQCILKAIGISDFKGFSKLNAKEIGKLIIKEYNKRF